MRSFRLVFIDDLVSIIHHQVLAIFNYSFGQSNCGQMYHYDAEVPN